MTNLEIVVAFVVAVVVVVGAIIINVAVVVVVVINITAITADLYDINSNTISFLIRVRGSYKIQTKYH